MFNQLRNIDTAFQHVKRFSIVLILACAGIMCFGIWFNYRVVTEAQERVHILYNGKVFEAFASTRKANLPVELRDHIQDFHHYFFDQSPDDQEVKRRMSRALYLADGSAKRQYDNLVEQGYYNNLVSANVNTEVEVDSIRLDVSKAPYAFTCYATEKLVRSSSTVMRKLVTAGVVEIGYAQTDNNPHGFMISGWRILVNGDDVVLKQ
jgi:conjugative transposon TraK protein